MKRAIDIAASLALGLGMVGILAGTVVAVLGFVVVQRVAERTL